MRELFEDLKIWRFENEGRQNALAAEFDKIKIMETQEHMELSRFGSVVCDWRAWEKKKNKPVNN